MQLACTNEGWNTVFVMQLVQMRGGETQYNIICFATCVDEVDSCSGTQGATSNYHGNQAFQANN